MPANSCRGLHLNRTSVRLHSKGDWKGRESHRRLDLESWVYVVMAMIPVPTITNSLTIISGL